MVAATPHSSARSRSLRCRLVRSKYLHAVANSKRFVVWHSLFGQPTILNCNSYAFLEHFETPTPAIVVLNRYPRLAGARQLLDSFRRLRFLNPPDFDERAFLERRIQARITQGLDGSFIDYLELRVCEACNFSCSYCILRNAVRIKQPRFKRVMDYETATKALDLYLALLMRHSKQRAEITFGGGEPTLNWPLIEKCVDYATRAYGRRIRLIFYLNTNFSLVDDARAAFLSKHGFRMAPSIDGATQRANDSTRRTKTGLGTFATIMNAVRELRKAGVRIPACSTTTDEANFRFIDRRFVDWAVNEGFRAVNINVDVMNPTALRPDEIASRLLKLSRYAGRRRVGFSGFWRRPAENLSSSLIRHRTGFCGAVRGDNLAVDPLGDIYSCGYSNRPIGSIHRWGEFFANDGPYHQLLRAVSPLANSRCRGCEIEGYCGGGCLATQEFSERNDLPEKMDQMCELYRLMTRGLLRESIVNTSGALEPTNHERHGKEGQDEEA